MNHRYKIKPQYWSEMCVCVFAGITVLLSLTVFMLLVAEIMPATSDSVPLIGKCSLFGFQLGTKCLLKPITVSPNMKLLLIYLYIFLILHKVMETQDAVKTAIYSVLKLNWLNWLYACSWKWSFSELTRARARCSDNLSQRHKSWPIKPGRK